MSPAKFVSVYNISRRTMLARRAEVACSFRSRLRGLLGRTGLPPQGGLIIQPCNMVHMWGMKFPIDVVYVSGAGEVLACVHQLRPWQVAPYVKRAGWVLELPAGVLATSGTLAGDMVEMGPALPMEG